MKTSGVKSVIFRADVQYLITFTFRVDAMWPSVEAELVRLNVLIYVAVTML